jgi:hypothetical protein
MPRTARLVLPCLAAAAVAACSAGGMSVEPVAVRDAAAAAPVPLQIEPPPPADDTAPRPAWALDRADTWLSGRSLAEIREQPHLMADRRLPTASLLPPPADGRFAWTISGITPEIRERMGESWSEACPVRLEDLRYVTVVFRGFDGGAHTGELVVNAGVAETVVAVFAQLYAEDFPVEEMRLVNTADHHAPPTGDGNNTAGYNCRTARGQGRWSAHAFGIAVDINPFQNPMVRRGTVTPELAVAYVDRGNARPGMLTEDSPAVRVFREHGWVWGGDWVHSKDYMHFSPDGT